MEVAMTYFTQITPTVLAQIRQFEESVKLRFSQKLDRYYRLYLAQLGIRYSLEIVHWSTGEHGKLWRFLHGTHPYDGDAGMLEIKFYDRQGTVLDLDGRFEFSDYLTIIAYHPYRKKYSLYTNDPEDALWKDITAAMVDLEAQKHELQGNNISKWPRR